MSVFLPFQCFAFMDVVILVLNGFYVIILYLSKLFSEDLSFSNFEDFSPIFCLMEYLIKSFLVKFSSKFETCRNGKRQKKVERVITVF